jgi:hypothetical protein
MSIPLDRLYFFIENITTETYGDCAVIYHFWPNGSKNLQDLNCRPFYQKSWFERIIRPSVWCHDQEPLDYEFYKINLRKDQCASTDIQKTLGLFPPSLNLNHKRNIFKKNILVHSEKRSQNVEKYIAEDELIPVYYWSHAVIARDWYRYAEHENFKNKNIKKTFLIYNRAWSGTREYRLRFSDLLVEHELVEQCLTFFNVCDNEQYYADHTFNNPIWHPKNVLENFFLPSTADSTYSADFTIEDYQSTEIEVVLETLFDDDRLHLTEKSLRPIACRQPFILAATHGSLQYLRDYGFQTYDSVWDESYDTIEDPVLRMQAIIKLMREITAWTDFQRSYNTQHMKQIADYNKKHFFSKDFSDKVIGELRTNMRLAFDQIKENPGFDCWVQRWQCLLQFPEMQKFLSSNEDLRQPNEQQYSKILDFIQQYPKKHCLYK